VNQLASLASRAAREELLFLIAGGHAVITHGFPRSTFDLDLIVRRTDRESWLRVVEGLGYRLHREGNAFIQLDAAGAESFPLDLMLVNDPTFSQMHANSLPAPVDVPGLRVVSLLHLLALKCHAIRHGHAGRIVKDAEDVIQLIQVNRLDPEKETLRELFEKHGTPELYQKVKRACRDQ
jgi:hypothetical protein